MLAGKRTFVGDEISDTLASVLKEDPDWSALPADVPASLRRVLRRCLSRTVLTAAQGTPAFVPPNQLVFMRKGTLLAQRFDLDRYLLEGDATALADAPRAMPGSTGNGFLTASAGGTIAYIADRPVNTSLVWFDQSGHRIGNVSIPSGDYVQVALARDGRQAVLTRQTSATLSDLWLIDLDRGSASRFTDTPGNNRDPVWSPDRERIAFSTNRDGPEDIFVKSVNAGTPEEPMFRSKVQFKRTQSWSVDGKHVVSMELSPDTNVDLFVITLADRSFASTDHRSYIACES